MNFYGTVIIVSAVVGIGRIVFDPEHGNPDPEGHLEYTVYLANGGTALIRSRSFQTVCPLVTDEQYAFEKDYIKNMKQFCEAYGEPLPENWNEFTEMVERNYAYAKANCKLHTGKSECDHDDDRGSDGHGGSPVDGLFEAIYRAATGGSEQERPMRWQKWKEKPKRPSANPVKEGEMEDIPEPQQ